ncbi:MAG: hypothetical protein IJV40_16325 [Oscillospiraceae bacterium]|nr:hypothetical protein [Oscillospiraceae bacterium]
MVYPFMTLNDGTEIVHSEMKEDGSVKVYIEKPIMLGFQSVECWLPKYEWKNNNGFTENELAYYDEFVHSTAHLILRFAKGDGLENAPDL